MSGLQICCSLPQALPLWETKLMDFAALSAGVKANHQCDVDPQYVDPIKDTMRSNINVKQHRTSRKREAPSRVQNCDFVENSM